MKKFESVLEDIEKMSGMRLESIRPGAQVKIDQVDWDDERILLTDASGNSRSRTFGEINKLWSALTSKPAIHVDSELRGSGSSRNQPETILANLPYVEFFKLNRRKHLTLIDKPSHHYGTLKELDSILREKIRQSLLERGNATQQKNINETFVISKNLAEHSDLLEEITGQSGECLEQGVYEYKSTTSRFILISSSVVEQNIPNGTYALIQKHPPHRLETTSVQLFGKNYSYHRSEGMCLMFDSGGD